MVNPFSIVLLAPEIPGNTGSIGRTALALNARLILIKPYGFELSQKSVRRAGLDYWKHVKLTEYDSFEDFLEKERPEREKMYLLSKRGEEVYYRANFSEGAYLIFGPETRGIPPSILESYHDRTYSLPQYSPHIRSLNLSNVVTAVGYEALRQMEYS